MLKQVQHDGILQVHSDDVVSTGSITANDKQNSILLYICTLRPVAESEKSFWLGGEEIRCDVISHYQKVAMECGIDMQVVFDSGNEMESEEELGYEKVEDCHSEFVSESVTNQTLKRVRGDEKYQLQHDGLIGGTK